MIRSITIPFCNNLDESGNLAFIVIGKGPMKDFHFLVDTGSSYTLLFKTREEILQLGMAMIDGAGSVSGIGGQKEAFLAKGQIHLGDISIEMPFQVMESNDSISTVEESLGFRMDGILGMDIMRLLNCSFDVKNGCMVARYKSNPVKRLRKIIAKAFTHSHSTIS